MSSFERIFQIHSTLRKARRPVPISYFEQELEVSRKTLKRDFEYLKDRLGAPLVYERERNGHWYDPEAPQFELPGFWLSASELHALLACEQLLERVQPGLMEARLQPLRQRIQRILGRSGHDAERISQRVKVQPIQQRAAPEPVFSVVADATLEGRQLRFTYRGRSRNQTGNRLTDPQRLVYYRSNWYLLAYCQKAEKLRLFSLDRIVNPHKEDDQSLELPDEELDDYTSTGFGIFGGTPTATGHLCFTPSAARWVGDETWHPDQKGEWRTDGYHLHIPYSNPTELIMEILRYGPDVEVLGPEDLRAQVRERIREMGEVYGGC